MGVDLRPVAAYCPTQNSITERHVAMWKEAAKKLIDQYSIDFEDKEMVQWLIAMTTWAVNSRVGKMVTVRPSRYLDVAFRCRTTSWMRHIAYHSTNGYHKISGSRIALA